jgi:transcriptional regulator with XRE-family HTH domain
MSESDTLALQCVGRILKPARLMAGKGMRQFAQEIGLLPSRISEIETGSAPTAAELKLMADALEAARREGIDWRESTVATLAARESELAEAQRRVAELESNLDAGRELLRVAWREFNAIRARDGAPVGICHDYWNELTEALRGLIGDDATPWMTRAARALVQPYESRVGRLTSQLVDMELRAIAAEKSLAQSTNYVADDELYPHVVWFANGRTVSIASGGHLEIGMGGRLAAAKGDVSDEP